MLPTGGPELMAFEFRCPYGLVFDEKKLVCEWPWLVPACSESGSSYTRMEYGGHTAGISAGVGVGGYVTGTLPEYIGATGTGYSTRLDYSKTTGSSAQGVNYFEGSTRGYIGQHTSISNSDDKTVSGHVGVSSSVGADYIGSTGGYRDSVSSIPTYTGSSGVHVSLVSPGTIVGGDSTGYNAGKTSNIGHTGYSTGEVSNAGSFGGIATSYSGSGATHTGDYSSTDVYSESSRSHQASSIETGSSLGTGPSYSGSVGGSGLMGSTDRAYTGSTGGRYSENIGGSHLTNVGTTYSGTYKPSYINTVTGGYAGRDTANNPTGKEKSHSEISGINYFGSTGSIGSSTSVHADSFGPRYDESTGLYTGSGATHASDYSSTDVYSETSRNHQASSIGTGSSFGTGSSYSGPVGDIKLTGSTDRGYTGSIGGGYSETIGGSHLTNIGATYSGTYKPSYINTVTGEYTESDTAGNPTRKGESYSKTSGINYFGSTGSTGSSTNVHAGSFGPKYDESTGLYTGSGATYAGDYSSTDVYSETSRSHQASSIGTSSSFGTGPSYSRPVGDIGLIGSIDRGYTGSTAGAYGQSTAGYSKPNDEIHAGFTETGSNVQSSTSSGRNSKTDFNSGISLGISGHSGVTSFDNSIYRDRSTSYSTTNYSPIGTRYQDKEGYKDPVSVTQEVLYTPAGATTYVKGHTETTGINEAHTAGNYGRTDLPRTSLNISTFGNEIPTAYDIQKGSTGAILTENNVEGSIHTGNFFSGTILSHGNIPGAVSTPSINQGSILTGEAQPGYVATSSGTPGYVIRDGIKTVNVESDNSGTFIYGTSTPGISLTSSSTSGVILKGDATPSVIFSGQAAPGVFIGGSVQPGSIIESSTGKPHVSQSETYSGISGSSADKRGSITYSSSTLRGGLTPTPTQSYRTDEGRGTVTFNTAYDINKYSGNDVSDYRPTSAILPDSVIPTGKIGITGNVNIHGSTFGAQDLSTATPGYTKSPVFTPSGFTKTGPTRTGITTAILGGGGSYSVSTSERRPILNPDNISERAFEGNAAYTKTSSNNIADLSGSLTPSGYPSTSAPIGRVTPQSGASGYSYPKPTVQFETGATFSSTPITPVQNYLSVTTPTPFVNVGARNGSLDDTNVFGSKIFTAPAHRGSSTPTSIIYTTPETYQTTLFEAARIPVSTVRPIIDNGYKTVITPSIPVSILTDTGFTQRTDGSQSQTASVSKGGSGVSFQRTDSSGQKDYSSFTSPSPSFGYLPAKSNEPDTIASTVKYDESKLTVRPDIGVTYKEPLPGSDIMYEGPSSVISPTTFRPSGGYYSGQEFRKPSFAGTTPSSGSPTNLDISRDKIDKLITNYDRGTVKYTTSVYDDLANSGFSSTERLPSSLSFTKSSSSVKAGHTFAITTPVGPTTYEVTTKSPESKGKVIVKWSDLHPLLLGKLGAECTCKADPFATLRGPVRKLIDSSRGKVDLTNYDESDIYVELENDKSYEEGDYTSSDDSSQPCKISPHGKTRVSPVLLTYLPVTSSVNTKDFVSSITSAKSDEGRSARFQVGFRTGKKLENVSSSSNSFSSSSYEEEEEEEEEEEDPDQIIDGATNCARPGLFRHPGLCNKFYACYWDQWKKKFTLHIFNCPIHLTFDSNAGACNWPSKGPACQADNLLV